MSTPAHRNKLFTSDVSPQFLMVLQKLFVDINQGSYCTMQVLTIKKYFKVILYIKKQYEILKKIKISFC